MLQCYSGVMTFVPEHWSIILVVEMTSYCSRRIDEPPTSRWDHVVVVIFGWCHCSELTSIPRIVKYLLAMVDQRTTLSIVTSFRWRGLKPAKIKPLKAHENRWPRPRSHLMCGGKSYEVQKSIDCNFVVCERGKHYSLSSGVTCALWRGFRNMDVPPLETPSV